MHHTPSVASSPFSIGSPAMSVGTPMSNPRSVASSRGYMASQKLMGMTGVKVAAAAEVKPDESVGLSESEMSFNAALWAYTARRDKRAAGCCLQDGNVGEVRSMARQIKMLSMNPSVYGNKYGVLGSS
jgi:hypothetical protein